MLKAIAAAARDDQLGLDGVEIEPNGPTQEDVEILERDAEHVGLKEPHQGVEGGTRIAAPSNPFEIAIE